VKMPDGMVDESQFEVKTVPLPEIKDGEFLIRVLYFAVDPYYRFFMHSKFIGKPLTGYSVGQVIASKNKEFPVGLFLTGVTGAVDYFISDGSVHHTSPADPGFGGFRVVDPAVVPLTAYLGILGMPGLTAYFGFRECLKFPKGGVVIVSAAAGVVGNIVGQLAKRAGAGKVIGIARGPMKCAALLARGFDVALDYKSPQFEADLIKATPDGADAYYDNVGGLIAKQCTMRLKAGGCLCECGSISQYNLKGEASHAVEYTPDEAKAIENKQLVKSQLQVFAHMKSWPEGLKFLTEAIRDKERPLKWDEYVVKSDSGSAAGLAQIPSAFVSLFGGSPPRGKVVVSVF